MFFGLKYVFISRRKLVKISQVIYGCQIMIGYEAAICGSPFAAAVIEKLQEARRLAAIALMSFSTLYKWSTMDCLKLQIDISATQSAESYIDA